MIRDGVSENILHGLVSIVGEERQVAFSFRKGVQSLSDPWRDRSPGCAAGEATRVRAGDAGHQRVTQGGRGEELQNGSYKNFVSNTRRQGGASASTKPADERINVSEDGKELTTKQEGS